MAQDHWPPLPMGEACAGGGVAVFSALRERGLPGSKLRLRLPRQRFVITVYGCRDPAFSEYREHGHPAVPKVKEAIHRTTWALGAPERKRMEELYKEHIQPHIPFLEMENVLLQLENLLKDRQILAANAQTAYQESKSIAAEVQGALRTLQNNAATNEQKKKAEGKGGKFFKSVRKMSGA